MIPDDDRPPIATIYSARADAIAAGWGAIPMWGGTHLRLRSPGGVFHVAAPAEVAGLIILGDQCPKRALIRLAQRGTACCIPPSMSLVPYWLIGH